MSIMTKIMRHIRVIVGVVVVIGIGATAYFFFSSSTANLTTGTGSSGLFGDLGQGGVGTPGQNQPGTGSSETIGTIAGSSGVEVAPRLIRITEGPVAYGLFALATTTKNVVATTSTESSTLPDTEIRFIDRGSGNMYAYRVSTRNLSRLSNRTIPGVQEVAWLPNGEMAYLRFLSEESDGSRHTETYALPAGGENGRALSRDLADVYATPSGGLLSLTSGTNGSTATLSKADGSGARTLFSSTLGKLFVFATDGPYFAATPSSARLSGYAFSVSASTGVFTRILGPLRGLSILPNHTGTKALFSYFDGTGMRLAVYDIAKRETVPLPVSTLAEKCAWVPDDTGAYCGVPVSDSFTNAEIPDDWYQGVLHTADRVWNIDLTDRVATLVANLPALSDTPIDAVSLTFDENSKTLSFISRTDGSLWLYEL